MCCCPAGSGPHWVAQRSVTTGEETPLTVTASRRRRVLLPPCAHAGMHPTSQHWFQGFRTSEAQPQTLGQIPRSQRAVCLHSPSWRGFPGSERLLPPTSPALTALSPQSNNYFSELQSRPLWQRHTTAFKGGVGLVCNVEPGQGKREAIVGAPVWQGLSSQPLGAHLVTLRPHLPSSISVQRNKSLTPAINT